MNDNNRFILKPHFGNLSERGLDYRDILTYITIKSYYNPKERSCFPTYETIAKHSGLSKKFVGDSVKRLETAGLVDIWKFGKFKVKHNYCFPQFDKYHKVSFDLLDLDLSANEKATLLLLREYVDGSYCSFKTITEIAKSSGVDVKLLDKNFKLLISKGYIATGYVDDLAEGTVVPYFDLTDKLTWSFKLHSLKGQTAPEKLSGMDIMNWACGMIKKMAVSKR